MPPRTGEDVKILAPHAELRGHVADSSDDVLTVALEQGPLRCPSHFLSGSRVEVECVRPAGVVHLPATVGAVHDIPPTLELRVAGAADRAIERRAHERVGLTILVSAWTPAQPTTRLTGRTVDVSVGGALLRLPGLALLAATLELRLELPDAPLSASTSIRWRREPDLVGVRFERIDAAEHVRLAELVDGR